jgi:hypothetical protein
MRKKLLFLFTLVLCGAMFTVNAQEARKFGNEPIVRTGSIVTMSTPTDLIFSEDFEMYNYFEEEGDIVTLEDGGWTLYDEDGDEYNWYVFPSDFYSKVATSASWVSADGALTPENWLVTPAIDLSTYAKGSIYLQYRVYAQDPDWPEEHYKIVVSTTDNLVASFIDENIVAEETIGDGIYFRNVDLSAFAGEVIHLAFVHYESTDWYRINFDKIQIYAGEMLSDGAEIEAFSFVEDPEAEVEMEGTEILVTVSAGTDITALTPSITVSAGATVEMLTASSTLPTKSGFGPIDFTEPVEFLVMAENGIEFNIYTVTVAEEELFDVTFNVDMTYADFDPASDVVFITGSILGWAEPGSDPDNQTMTQVGETMIWTKTLSLAPGEYAYKYFLNAGWSNGEWDGDPNRALTVAADMEVNDIFGWKTSVNPNVISNLNVYPNPFNNEIRIANAENVSRITITNLIGQVVMDMPYRGETTINTSDLNNGLYLVVFQSANGQRVVRKMIKQ